MKEGKTQVRFSLVKPPVGRGANQKPEEPLWNTLLATPSAGCLDSSFLPRVPTFQCGLFPAPLAFFGAPATRAGALWRIVESPPNATALSPAPPLDGRGEAPGSRGSALRRRDLLGVRCAFAFIASRFVKFSIIS